MMNRRQFQSALSLVLGGLMAAILAIPGFAYFLDPLLKRKGGTDLDAEGPADEGFQDLTRLSQLEPGKPRVFPVFQEMQDAWIRYPKEAVGSVWLIRNGGEEGTDPEVVAFTTECPHLGCAVNLSEDGSVFHCPCHNSSFTLEGEPLNSIPPRPMDTLVVRLSSEADPMVQVRYERYRTMSKEKTPIV